MGKMHAQASRLLFCILCFVFMVLVDRCDTFYAYDEYNDRRGIQKLNSVHLMRLNGLYGYGYGYYFPGNGTSDFPDLILKWTLGLSGFCIFFLLGVIVYMGRKSLIRVFVRFYRHLREYCADRKAQDRLPIMKDMDDDQFSETTDTRITVMDRVVYHKVPVTKPQSPGGGGADAAGDGTPDDTPDSLGVLDADCPVTITVSPPAVITVSPPASSTAASEYCPVPTGATHQPPLVSAQA